MDFQEFFERVVEKQATKRFYHPIPDGNVMDESFSPQYFEPGTSYFEIELAEMFLRDERRYWRTFVPLTIVISEFICGGKPTGEADRRQTVPFFVGNELLKEIEKYVKGEHIELYNTKVAGPVPYAGDGLSLFVGLFRIQVTDFVKNLLNLVQSIANTFNPAVLSSYMDVAKPLASGLPALLGMKEVELRLGTRDVFGTRASDPQRFKEGYLAYINCPEEKITVDRLRVKNRRLHIVSDKGSIEPLTGYDFCLVQISQLVEREDYATLPFHRLWKDAQDRVWSGEEEKGRRILLDILHQVAVSPDLTARNQNSLIQVYTANFENELARYKAAAGSTRVTNRGGTTRRTASAAEMSDPRDNIMKFAERAQSKGLSKRVVNDLFGISENWNRIPFPAGRPEKFELTNEVLKNQVKAFQDIRSSGKPNPLALADAITLSALRAV